MIARRGPDVERADRINLQIVTISKFLSGNTAPQDLTPWGAGGRRKKKTKRPGALRQEERAGSARHRQCILTMFPQINQATWQI
ncbi:MULTISPECIES: hypothetical protein [unclassified Bradyrhizobium]|uniref:hypothetical protein n=1 Tax=unclassified Bradyrhizobium TaxID=2631580 RepID=UPI0020B2D80C|nr:MULTISPECIES: hypothetical protein [unclassified Bradyrhizobium]MCP3397001.1 hypothetical protein [Bradyrhizobium sp. CCGB20]MCP3405513.1 hypothetical protein [Bradyrhizobium sp. CCGB01]